MPKIPEQGIFMSVSTASLNEAGILAYNDGNYAEAFKQFDAAARTGEPAGQHLLASLYYQGHGVMQDVPKAVELFTAAAQAGFPPSLANLALMYASGDGVPQDSGTSRRPKPVPCRRRTNTACCTRKGRVSGSIMCRRMHGLPCRTRRAARNRSRTATSCWKSSRRHSSRRRACWRPSMRRSMAPIHINSYCGRGIILLSASSLIIQ